jgi:hypothetical protein
MHLFGSAASFTGDAIGADKAAWYIDGEFVANGFDVWVGNPGKGRHEIRLQVADGEAVGSASTLADVISVAASQPTHGGDRAS